jgi:transcriptional regulator of NAD metabolism
MDLRPTLNIPRKDLISLNDVLQIRDIGSVDRILNELQSQSNDPETSQTLQQIAEHVLLADYEEASELIMKELKGQR